MNDKDFLKGKRGVAQSTTGGNWMAYGKDSVRHGFESKQVARAYSKHTALQSAKKGKKSDPRTKSKAERMKNFPDNYYV